MASRVENVVNSSEFENAVDRSSKQLVVIHFWEDWAPQCQQMNDVLEELFKDSNYKKVHFLKVQAESLADISEKCNITSVPTFLFFWNKIEVDRLEGANAPELIKKLKHQLNRTSVPLPSELKLSENDLNSRLKQLISKAPCMLFMKGSPEIPKCGFSKKVVELLNQYNADYNTFDILTDEEVRQGLKAYSNWPTYPQLYINGDLIGGLDILNEMAENGELESKLPKKQELNQRLSKLINKAPVMVFMKGSPEEPRCGFSKTLTSILKQTGITYDYFDILKDEEVRQGLKAYSSWPTYPQVYVKGNLIGGLDIIKELQESGDLDKTLKGEH